MNWVFKCYSDMYDIALFFGARPLAKGRARRPDGDPTDEPERLEAGEGLLARLVELFRRHRLQHRPTPARRQS